jgi:prepilin-type N-terminal cleavage/methylation domain-containing protein
VRIRPSNPPCPAAGFTLVELLIVVVLIGILASIALPSARHDRSDAVRSALKANVQAVGMLIEFKHQQTSNGSYPAALDGAWFASGSLPSHPDQMADVPLVEIVSVAGISHPADKLISPGSPGAYWYNAKNGYFRARVKAIGTAAETLAYYNDVNGSSAGGLAATTDSHATVGGGSSGGSGGSAASGSGSGSSSSGSGSSGSSSGSGSSGSSGGSGGRSGGSSGSSGGSGGSSGSGSGSGSSGSSGGSSGSGSGSGSGGSSGSGSGGGSSGRGGH